MSKWLRVHKKILIHGSILFAFLLYAFFLADPIFDRFEASEIGYSKLHKISLPVETDNIVYDIGGQGNPKLVELLGWAFIQRQNVEDSQYYVVLNSTDSTYVFDTLLFPKPNVTQAYAHLNINLDNSGFFARVPMKKIEDGTYRVGIYIKKKHIEALRYTDKVIVKFGSDVKLIKQMSE